MYNSNIPSDRELPCTATLIKSTIVAAIVASVLLVAVVMPSEYAIDPTGFGELTGLKRMGEIRISLAEAAEADTINIAEANKVVAKVVETKTVETPSVSAPNNTAYQNHKMTFSLAPDEGTEVKVTMAKGAKVDYIWETNGGKSNFDVHGDSKKLKIKYHPYYKGSDSKREGTLEAAFDGGHGWFWRNRTKQPLTITIKTNGEYTAIKRY
ncbi:MAG: hypothetical protein ACJATV_001212 [Granulosicoccus sp.]|jgi:hypothetical protein